MAVNFAYKTVLFVLGWVCVLLGIIGALLPVIPTTPFLILAAFLFSKSSPRVHSWLTSLPVFGDVIIDWEKNGVIRPKAKIASVTTIIVVFSSTLIFTRLHYGLKIMLVFIAIGCISFIVTRKSAP
ncbi:MAG: hypothetical protein CME65_01800 [Halobacteriovoraceae bacterium]|nr:hypothetical protein [Halobacteriovoraceae bacterium]